MKLRLTLAAGAFVLSLSAYAHHSFPATYRMDQEVTLEGELVAFMYRNPHSFVHLNITDEKGETTRWAIEWGGASFLSGQGITRTTFFDVEADSFKLRFDHSDDDGTSWKLGTFGYTATRVR